MLPSVEVSQSPVDKFREYLSTRKDPQRFTEQQRELVEYIFTNHEHFQADDLMDNLKKASYKISRATVYRTLTKLVDAGLLRRLEIGPRTYYEHDYGYPQHDHLYCEKCHKMIEFQSPVVEASIREICEQQGFRIEGHTLIVRGKCADCLKKQAERGDKQKLDLI